MKIVHVITRFAQGGTERNIVQFMDWERKLGHEVMLVVGGTPDRTLLPSWLPLVSVNHLSREINPVRDALGLKTLRDLFRRLQPDVLHTHQSKAGILGRLAARKHVPVLVHTVHMVSFGPSYGRKSRVLLAAERFCADRTDVMVAVGDELRDDYLAAGVGHDVEFRVIHSAVGIERFAKTRALRGNQLDLRRQLGLPNVPAVLVTAGALETRKRHRLLFEQLRPLLLAGDAVLLLAGDGPLRDELMVRARSLGIGEAIRFLGQVKDLERIYAAADLYVHAALAEGVPQVVIQALAAGLPVAATKATGLREVADAPLLVARSDGSDLLECVRYGLDSQLPPVPLDRLQPWSQSAVEAEVIALSRLLEDRRAGIIPSHV